MAYTVEPLFYDLPKNQIGVHLHTNSFVHTENRERLSECIAERGETQWPIRYSICRHARALPV